ncbi:HlyD family efflux transporter periplasmic adaptor subunit [Burkholderia glumae]|uniref:HlyD family secretion protein n=1 Tax=Burkholderia glumae TaxID=337 RepID=UPI00129734F9|nr:HlyD family efflux transporter periplasmic adaptor subunit [Burkholderia glumae]QGA39576.1 HlyD family efflux transporter periplasmic adaptor subunit [Burkholderia glumae]
MNRTDNPQAAAGAAAPPPAEPALPDRRRRYFRWFFIALALAALAGGYWWIASRDTETTDDAYVTGDVVQVSPQVAGTVDAIMVQNAEWVRAGDPLFRIDPTDARLALDDAVAQLAREAAQILLRKAELSKASDDLQRRLGLAQDGGVSREDLRHARDAMDSASAALDAQQAAYDASRARIDGTSIDSNPLVRAAAARVRSAALALRRTEIRAPLAGLVTRRAVQVGQHVAPGTPAMALVPLEHVWVEANFKESQLRGMHAGQAVTLRSDLYGASVVFHGRIEGVEAGTGSAFASVPAQNATGNWIKVVQRVPVRIALDPGELRAHPLRIGLSMNASVALGDGAPGTASASMQTTSAAARRPVDATSIFDDDASSGDALVIDTIRANDGAAAARAPGA